MCKPCPAWPAQAAGWQKLEAAWPWGWGQLACFLTQIACGAAHSVVMVRGEGSGGGGGRADGQTDGRASSRPKPPGGGGGGGGGGGATDVGLQCYTFGAHAAGQLGRVVTGKSTHASPRPAELAVPLMAPPVEIPVKIVVPSAPPYLA